jgi:glycine/D-amino acid oxidase-like deaminating enzyme
VVSAPGRSLWDAGLPEADRFAGAPLPGDTAVDVAIVGAGFTGLWTAISLAEIDPSLRIVVVERDTVGFGASGRNGGWCSALLPMSLPTIAERHGRSAAVRLQRTMHDTVRIVGESCERYGIDAAFQHGGTIDLARSAAQVDRHRATLAEYASFGFGEEDHRWLEDEEARAMCGATEVRGALFTPHCAVVDPARLVHGLARVAASLGVTVHEHTAATAIEPGAVRTERGTVRAEVVVRATEGFTAQLPGARRELVPLYSMMIATEPLPAEVWDRIGLADRPSFDDGRRLLIYGQRTRDGRLAFGGRGAPYHFGSAIRPEFDTDPDVAASLASALRALFPVLGDAAITHHWGGPLAVARDWHASVRFDRATGRATAGGYVGDGVATANLAGRTLAHLITGTDSELVRLPWVGHRSRSWEPEPLRWLGINAGRVAAARADQVEERTGRPSRFWESVITNLLGR